MHGASLVWWALAGAHTNVVAPVAVHVMAQGGNSMLPAVLFLFLSTAASIVAK